MKNKLIATILMTNFLLLTACSTPGTSSATPPTSEAESSKAAVSSKADTSSRATSSSKYAPTTVYTDYAEYFSKIRAVESSSYFEDDGNNYYVDNGQYVMPIPYTSRRRLRRLAAQTKSGVLFAYEGDIYRITKAGRCGSRIYSGEDLFYPEQILPVADEHVFFVINRNEKNPNEFQICRIFRPTGQVDIIATNEQIEGDYNDAWVWANHLLLVESYVPYEIKPGSPEGEAYAAAEAARRMALINTFSGEILQSSDPRYTDEINKWRNADL